MGLQEWKKKFYPKKPTKKMTKIEAIQHSLKKWEGLKTSVLVRFKIEKNGDSISDGFDRLDMTAGSCALCVKYHNRGRCSACPLEQHLGQQCDGCDATGEYGPYLTWIDEDKTAPMVRALRATLKKEQSKGKKK